MPGYDLIKAMLLQGSKLYYLPRFEKREVSYYFFACKEVE